MKYSKFGVVRGISEHRPNLRFCTLFLLTFINLCLFISFWAQAVPFLIEFFSPSGVRQDIDIEEIVKGIRQDDPRLTEYILKNHVFPPSPKEIPYNLTNSTLLEKGQDPSEGQTAFVLKLLGSKVGVESKNGFFVEAGAVDGEVMSNTLALERDLNWTGILVEAQPIEFANLRKKNRKSYLLDICISPEKRPIKSEFLQRKDGFTIGSKLGQSSKQAFGYLFTPLQIQCFPIYSILKALNVTQVDYLSLDVEGIEFDVLKTIPYDQVTFKVISIEVQFLEEKETLKKFLEEKGYIFVQEFYLDYIFVHSSVGYKRNKSLI